VTDIDRLLEDLTGGGVDFVIIGGVAMVLRGSTRVTVDLDICYERSQANLERLASALAPHHPRLRGAPPELPFLWDGRTLRSGLNFTLTTELGDLDLLGEVPGLGGFEAVLAGSSVVTLNGKEIRVLGLDALERSKRAAGRAKDLLDLGEIAEIRRQSKP
jgi:hypothetical protein